MPHTKSADKRVRQNEKRRLRNKAQRSATRTQVKKFIAAAEAGGRELAEKEFHLAVSAVDKATKAGIFHGNKAARLKAGLAARLNRVDAAASAPTEAEGER